MSGAHNGLLIMPIYACITLALRLHYTCWPSIYFLAIFKNNLALYYQANFMDIRLLLFLLPTHFHTENLQSFSPLLYARLPLLLPTIFNDVIIHQISMTSLFSNFFLLPPFCL